MGKRQRESEDGAEATEFQGKLEGSELLESSKSKDLEKKKKKKKKKHLTEEKPSVVEEEKLADDKKSNDSDHQLINTEEPKDKSIRKKEKKEKKKSKEKTSEEESKKKDSSRKERKRRDSELMNGNEAEEKIEKQLGIVSVSPPPQSRDEKQGESEKKEKKKKKKKQKSQDVLTAAEMNGSSGKGAEHVSKSVGDNANQEEERDLFKLPSIEEIVAHQSKKRKAFLSGYASSVLPTATEVFEYDEQTKHKFLEKVTALCEKVMGLTHDTIVSVNRWSEADRKEDMTSMEETLASDLIRLKKLPVAKQYVEMTLWKRSLQVIRDQLQAASRLGFGKGFPRNDPEHTNGLLLHRDDDPDAEFVSYREAYRKSLVERFSESLDKMRQAEDMDADRVQFLLRCLDSGASLFANLQCIDNAGAKAKR